MRMQWGCREEVSCPGTPRLEAGKGQHAWAVYGLYTPVQTTLALFIAVPERGTGSGADTQAGSRSPTRQRVRAGWRRGDEQDMEDARGGEG